MDQIVSELRKTGLYEVEVASFTPKVPFLDQLSAIRSTDILVGVHGAGLTHLLFLPDWAQVCPVRRDSHGPIGKQGATATSRL